MAVKVAEKYQDVSSFVSSNMKLVSEKDGEKRFQVNQEHYVEFMESKGITKETLKQVSNANSDYHAGTMVVLKDQLLEDPKVDRVTINTRTASGVISERMTRQVESRTPGTGEKVTKFGVVSIKLNMKSRLDRELVDECSAEIEAAMK